VNWQLSHSAHTQRPRKSADFKLPMLRLSCKHRMARCYNSSALIHFTDTQDGGHEKKMADTEGCSRYYFLLKSKMNLLNNVCCCVVSFLFIEYRIRTPYYCVPRIEYRIIAYLIKEYRLTTYFLWSTVLPCTEWVSKSCTSISYTIQQDTGYYTEY